MSSLHNNNLHEVIADDHHERKNKKKRKVRSSGEKKPFRFKRFGENGYPVEFLGHNFRENVKALVEFGHWDHHHHHRHRHDEEIKNNYFCSSSTTTGTSDEDDDNHQFQSWSFQLEVQRHPPFHLLLFVVEEPIELSPTKHCKQCQYVGWGHHMICNKKYHFLLPSKDTMIAAAAGGGGGNGRSSIKRSSSSGMISSNNLVELQGHILHGVFHSNGFGHLLCLNGLETGSNLPGYLLMDFWDRLCTGLKARKVSLNDTSQKSGMELRLIYGAAYRQSWFGRWDYKFSRGTFNVTHQMYQKAIEAIQNTPLSLLLNSSTIITNHTHQIVSLILSKYQTLSDHSLLTLGDLFHFMLELKSRLTQSQDSFVDTHNLSGFLLESSCRWSPKRVEMAVRVIIEALKRAEFRWVSRQEVRDKARMYIGDTGLLDFVLKSLGNHVVGNYLVRRTLNPVTKVLEYCLQDICHVFPKTNKTRYRVGRVELTKDIINLYRFVLSDDNNGILSVSAAHNLSLACGIVLDSKFFVKEYNGDPPTNSEMGIEGKLLNLFCTIRLLKDGKCEEDDDDDDQYQDPANDVVVADDGTMTRSRTAPYECIVMKNVNATIDELKVEVEKSFREIYWGLRSFGIESILNLSNAKGSDLVFGLVEVGRKLIFEGNINGKLNSSSKNMIIKKNEIYENGGKMNWVGVDCVCGAKEDDGERMVSCDICEVWQHTRCVNIPNQHQIPHIFLCNRCDNEIALLPSLP